MAVRERPVEPVAGLLARAGIPAARIAGHAPMTGGTYNSLHRIDLTDGPPLVLKVPPSPDIPRMAYETGLLHGEALFCTSAAAVGVPAPQVLHAEPDETGPPAPFLLMTHCPGAPWRGAGAEPDGAERDRLRSGLGGLVARLHTVRGPGFGYPAPGSGSLADRWATAFAAMTGAVLDDAERYRPWLPREVPWIRARLAAAAPVLDEVAEPALVHFDLWPGNVLLDGPVGDRVISGLIDGERMFWGDPLADFASMSLFDTRPEADAAFLAGYGAGGGRIRFDDAALRRIALYRCYLYLIMLVEVVPRGYRGEHLAWVREFAGPRLEAALGAVG
ncbi:phosphotransferase family protein [Streptomyces polygonati]|uniref:Phosphotransferase family protein n=1 Tax=Streptomyces polygonati TaxID=1617087 RepID=A0ABV8HHF5_9ACTN